MPENQAIAHDLDPQWVVDGMNVYCNDTSIACDTRSGFAASRGKGVLPPSRAWFTRRGDGWTSTEPEVGSRALARCLEHPRAGH